MEKHFVKFTYGSNPKNSAQKTVLEEVKKWDGVLLVSENMKPELLFKELEAMTRDINMQNKRCKDVHCIYYPWREYNQSESIYFGDGLCHLSIYTVKEEK